MSPLLTMRAQVLEPITRALGLRCKAVVHSLDAHGLLLQCDRGWGHVPPCSGPLLLLRPGSTPALSAGPTAWSRGPNGEVLVDRIFRPQPPGIEAVCAEILDQVRGHTEARLRSLLATPSMWGSPLAVEMQALQLVEILRLCYGDTKEEAHRTPIHHQIFLQISGPLAQHMGLTDWGFSALPSWPSEVQARFQSDLARSVAHMTGFDPMADAASPAFTFGTE